MAQLPLTVTYDATHVRHMSRVITLVPPEGFEPPTYGTGNRRSIP